MTQIFTVIRQSIGLQWNQIHSDLNVTAMIRKQKQTFRSSWDLPATSRSWSNFAIRNTCNKFNRGSEGSGCDYKQMCRHCGGRHPGSRCWKEHSFRFNSFLPTQSNQQNPKLSDANSKKTLSLLTPYVFMSACNCQLATATSPVLWTMRPT